MSASPVGVPLPVADVVLRSRSVALLVEAVEQSEGVGARVRRSIGGAKTRNFDPFLMLDEGKVGSGAGFPDHPHRGFETVSYLLEGSMKHEDCHGHRGVMTPGCVSWMTAGRGVVHSEMPGPGGAHGMQLWVNLCAKDKMVPPVYQDLSPTEIPTPELGGVTARVIAGTAFGVSSRVFTRTPTFYLDFTMAPGSLLTQALPLGWNSFVYVLSGSAKIGDVIESAVAVPTQHTALLSCVDGEDGLRVWAGEAGCRLLLLSGKPIGEPIVQHGPFVMNTRAEIQAAVTDYQTGRNGFEKAAAFLARND